MRTQTLKNISESKPHALPLMFGDILNFLNGTPTSAVEVAIVLHRNEIDMSRISNRYRLKCRFENSIFFRQTCLKIIKISNCLQGQIFSSIVPK